jgi:hypothetical protein
LPLDLALWENEEILSTEDNKRLCRPFYRNETENDLFQMEHNKASGTDSISIEFFQSCWGIAKKDIIEMINDFHKGRLNVSRLKYVIITLLPNLAEALKFNNSDPCAY